MKHSSFMYVDIHTHTFSQTQDWAVYNLRIQEIEKFLSSDIRGYFSMGLHPWYLDSISGKVFDIIPNGVKDKRIVAVGECGLDKNSNTSLEEQISVFEKQIELSEEVKKPLIIHCVGCYNELIALKKEINPTQSWIVHGFRGKPQLAEQVLKNEINLSYGEFFNDESLKITPLENLFIETDQSKAFITNLYEKVAEIKNCSLKDIDAGSKLLCQIKCLNNV